MDFLEVALLGKPECSLCDEADDLLFQLSVDYPLALLKLDITEDPKLLAAYGDRIPVVQFRSGRELFAPLEEAAVRAAIERELAEAGPVRQRSPRKPPHP